MDSSKVTRELIPEMLRQLPSENWLPKLKTDDLLNLWYKTRRNQQLVAIAWECMYTGGDKFKQQFEAMEARGKIDVEAYRLIEKLTSHYLALWELTEFAFAPFTEKMCLIGLPSPFNSPFALYSQLQSEVIDTVFIDATKPYVELSAKRAEKLLRLKMRSFDVTLKPHEQAQLERFIKEYQPQSLAWWHSFLDFVSRQKHNKTLWHKFQNYRHTEADLMRTTATLARHKFSVAWKKGVMLVGTNLGIYTKL